MAKINNQAVMQKLIDELKLYPGKDLIPSELADKILAVYQVNDQEVSVKTPTANVVKSATANGTIYAVPATGKFYLTNVHVNAAEITGVNGATQAEIVITPKDGAATTILQVSSMQTATWTGSPSSNASLNLQNPILLEPGTNILLTENAQISFGSIVGYLED